MGVAAVVPPGTLTDDLLRIVAGVLERRARHSSRGQRPSGWVLRSR